MRILEEIIDSLPTTNVPVRRVLLGVHWTAVCSEHCGLASTLTSEDLPYTRLSGVGNYLQASARDLAALALSDNHYECSIGMAAINSLLCPNPPGSQELNAYDWIFQNAPGKDVAIIGHFPFVEKMQGLARNLWVIEKHPRPGDIPAKQSAPYLADAQIIAITGSSIVNHSFEEVLAMCNMAATIMVLGPSTPLSPVLFSHGISILAGAFVVNEEKALLTIEQGGSFSQLQGVKRISIFKAGVA
jgi:uncharacterized protein (DUF4213/DUF364 family)